MIYLLAIVITAFVVVKFLIYTLKNLLYVATPNQVLGEVVEKILSFLFE